MVSRGSLFWIYNPHEENTQKIPHLHFMVGFGKRKEHELIIGTSKINYILINKLEFVEVDVPPTTRITYFITNRRYIVEGVRFTASVLANPDRFRLDQESEIFKALNLPSCISKLKKIPIDKRRLISFNTGNVQYL